MASKNTNNKFVVSVCDAYALDPVTKAGLWAGYANITSAFTIAMTATDVRGGKGNQMLYRYLHDRVVTVTVTAATFSPTILSMNVGSDIVESANANVWTTECLTFTEGKATMTETAVGVVTVFFEDGTAEVVTPATKAITLTDTTFNGKANVGYNSMITKVNQIAVDTTKAPKIVELILVGEIKDADGVVTQTLNIDIPRFSVDGNYELSFASDGVSQDSLTGTALSVTGATCDSGNGYAWVSLIDAPTA